jgi:hypothetical protein
MAVAAADQDQVFYDWAASIRFHAWLCFDSIDCELPWICLGVIDGLIEMMSPNSKERPILTVSARHSKRNCVPIVSSMSVIEEISSTLMVYCL